MQFAALPRRYKYETVLGDVKTSRTSKCADTTGNRAVAMRFVQESFYVSPDQKQRSATEQQDNDQNRGDRTKKVYIKAVAVLLGLNNPYMFAYNKLMTGIAAGRLYLPMSFIRGMSLREWIAAKKEARTPPTPAEVWRLIAPIVSAVAYLHSNYKTETYINENGEPEPIRQLYHGGIHPGNILITEGGSSLMADPCINRTSVLHAFIQQLDEVSKQMHDKLEAHQAYLSYVAPEALQSLSHSPASDVWSLGMIVLEMVSLKKPRVPPYGAEAVDYFSKWSPPDTSSYSNEIAYFLESTLILSPEKRISASDLLQLPFIQRVIQERIASMKMHVTVSSDTEVVMDDASANDRQSAEQPVRPLSAETFRLMFPGEEVPACILKKDREQKRSKRVPKASRGRDSGSNGEAAADEMASPSPEKIPGRYKNSHTGLIKAISDNHIDAIKALAKYARTYDKNGLTALAHAALLGRTEAVEVLLPHEGGMHLKCEKDIASLLYSSPTSMMLAASEGNDSVIRILRDCEAGAYTPDHCRTALMAAAACGYSSIVSLLASSEAGMRTDNGTTALMLSARGGRIECVSILAQKEHGLVDKWGNSALVLAAVNGHIPCVEILAEYEGAAYARRAISLAPKDKRDVLMEKLTSYMDASTVVEDTIVIL